MYIVLKIYRKEKQYTIYTIQYTVYNIYDMIVKYIW